MTRRLAYLRQLLPLRDQPEKVWEGQSCFLEIPVLELSARGEPALAVSWANIERSLAMLHKRQDCQDFAMAGLVRMLYRYRDSHLLTAAQWSSIEGALLGTIYWVDEPGEEHCVFSSENHQILYHSAELLVGQRFPDVVFANNQRDGRWHYEHARDHILRWLDWRTRLSFCEWNSSCYYDEDAAALLNLIDFAADAELRHRARVVFDLLLFHVALNTWRGLTGCSQGRVYDKQIFAPESTPTATLAQLAWGDQTPTALGLGAVALATSEYEIPPVLAAIGRDEPVGCENRERHGIDTVDAARYGLRPDAVAHLHYFLAAGQGQHPQVVPTARAFMPEKHGHSIWGIKYAHEFYQRCPAADPDPSPTALTQADVYTFRTPEFMLSCAQDYRRGKPGYQQHIWQATLGERAFVFTTNPARKAAYNRPGLWAGNGSLPKAVAHRNVLLCLYRVAPYPIWDQPPWYHEDYAHAWFPREAFDEVVEQAGWCVGRNGDGYVALKPTLPARWNGTSEWIVDGTHCAWVCELGSRRLQGEFAAFVRRVTSAGLTGDEGHLVYESPSLGRVEAGWDEPLRVNGEVVAIHDYPRFENPYCRAEFGSSRFEIRHGGHEMILEASP